MSSRAGDQSSRRPVSHESDAGRDRRRRHERDDSHHDGERRARREDSVAKDRRSRREDGRSRREDRGPRQTETEDRQRSRSRDAPRRHREEEREEREKRRREDDEGSEHEERRRRRHRRDEDGERLARDERPRRRPHDEVASVQRRGPLPDQADSFALVQQGGDGDAAAVQPAKEKPNYGVTGALAAASNAVAQADGSMVTLKYHEPPEARKPAERDGWRLFVFKGGAIVDTVELGARSCWLVGREAAVVDLLAAHPSVSKQHAVLQFRYLERRNEYGDRIGRVRPYLLDLASANGTLLNGEAVAAQRFVELRERDMVQFGDSTREYVLMQAK